MITTSPYPHGGILSEQAPFFERIGQNPSIQSWGWWYGIVSQFDSSSLYNISIGHHSIVQDLCCLGLALIVVLDASTLPTDNQHPKQECEENSRCSSLEQWHFEDILPLEGVIITC